MAKTRKTKTPISQVLAIIIITSILVIGGAYYLKKHAGTEERLPADYTNNMAGMVRAK